MRFKFRSVGEGIEFERLKSLTRENYLSDIDYEPTKIPYILSKYGIPDYRISINTGMGGHKEIYLEYKDRDQRAGLHVLDNRKKYIAMRDQNPHIDLRFIFSKPGLKVSKTLTYEQWADKNHFKYYYAGKFTLEDLL